MNPSGAFWCDLFGRLIVESSALVALAGLVTRKMSAQQQRKVWQVALGMLLLLLLVEGAGLPHRFKFASAPPKAASTSRRLTIQVLPAQSMPSTGTPSRAATGIPAGTWIPGMIWLAICACVVARSFGSRLLFLAFKGRRQPLNDAILQGKVNALVHQMNLRGRIHLSESAHLTGPIAFGFLRRCICLPENFAQRAEPREQEVMLAHEVAHLAVRDPFWYAVVDLTAALFCFNPLVWFGRSRFRAACETAADEASLLVHEGAPTLAECLVQLGKRLAGVNSYGWLGIEGTGSALWRRVNHLLKLEKSWRPLSPRWVGTIYAAGVLILVAIVGSSAAFARNRSPSLAQHLWNLGFAQVAQPTPASDGNETLHTRAFHVDAPRFEQSVREFLDGRKIPPGDSFTTDLKLFFEAAGVDLRPPAQLFYNSRTGTLMVRAELQALDAAEKVVQVQNTAPQQVTIETKFVEFSDQRDILELRNLVIGRDQSDTNSFIGILPPSRYRELIKRLEARTGVDILSAPKMTTLDRRPAQIKVVDVSYIATDIDPLAGQTNTPKWVTEPFELGPCLDVVPVVQPDGVSIEMTMISTIREFIGYDMGPQRYFDSGPPRPLTPAPIREYLRDRSTAANNAAQVDTPLPTFRVRQAQTNARVWDGQTVALALEPQTPPSKNPNLRYTSSGRAALVFVTPTLIDRAGNRWNNESALPFIEQTVPK